MENYEELLNKAYENVRVVQKSSERFEVPRASGIIQGKNTIITNIADISKYLRRPLEQIAKFLQNELATSGKIEIQCFV